MPGGCQFRRQFDPYEADDWPRSLKGILPPAPPFLQAMVQADGASALSRIDPGIPGNRDAISACQPSARTPAGRCPSIETTWSWEDCLRRFFRWLLSWRQFPTIRRMCLIMAGMLESIFPSAPPGTRSWSSVRGNHGEPLLRLGDSLRRFFPVADVMAAVSATIRRM